MGDPLASLWMGMGADFALQLSADAASPYGGWQAPGNPLLAVMRARGESVTSQLQNLEETMCNDPPNCFPEWSSSQCLNRATACTNSGRSSDSIEVTSFILSLLVFLNFWVQHLVVLYNTIFDVFVHNYTNNSGTALPL